MRSSSSVATARGVESVGFELNEGDSTTEEFVCPLVCFVFDSRSFTVDASSEGWGCGGGSGCDGGSVGASVELWLGGTVLGFVDGAVGEAEATAWTREDAGITNDFIIIADMGVP